VHIKKPIITKIITIAIAVISIVTWCSVNDIYKKITQSIK